MGLSKITNPAKFAHATASIWGMLAKTFLARRKCMKLATVSTATCIFLVGLASASSAELQCFVGEKGDDATNFTFDANRQTFSWNAGEASHPTRAKFQVVGKKVAIAVTIMPPMQGGHPVVGGAPSSLIAIYYDGNGKYSLVGDNGTSSGTCK
jgi:hypothetical protein